MKWQLRIYQIKCIDIVKEFTKCINFDLIIDLRLTMSCLWCWNTVYIVYIDYKGDDSKEMMNSYSKLIGFNVQRIIFNFLITQLVINCSFIINSIHCCMRNITSLQICQCSFYVNVLLMFELAEKLVKITVLGTEEVPFSFQKKAWMILAPKTLRHGDEYLIVSLAFTTPHAAEKRLHTCILLCGVFHPLDHARPMRIHSLH